VCIESLEQRQLLTIAAADLVVKPLLDARPAASGGSSVAGLTPQQVRKAYGFDQISFNGITGDGSGQTIAIVAAHDNPNAAADLHTFDLQFGLSDPPSFKQVSQTGGSTAGILADAGWATEISLDVQWAHAMAPKANILLVEANSASLGDLMTAVDYARHVNDVSVVSMSWGANEFGGQTAYDKYFTTPAGHQGVTFVAASGDAGSLWGPSWPSSSSNVLAVGGTSLSVNASGAYAGETGWGGSGGGASQFELAPSYQGGAVASAGRVAPDVSYNADPGSGFAVYNSFSGGGWQVVGGTSAGTPQWAGLIAIADQGREVNHLGTLDGASGTLPKLYAMYNDPATYAADFHDVVAGRSSVFIGARAGYDGVSGLGTPKADRVAAALAGLPTAAPQPSVASNAPSGGKTGRAPAAKPASVPVQSVTPPPTAAVAVLQAPALSLLAGAGREARAAADAGVAAAASSGDPALAIVGTPTNVTTTVVAAVPTRTGGGTFSNRLISRAQTVLSATPDLSSATSAAIAGLGSVITPSSPLLPTAAAVGAVAADAARPLFNFARIDWLSAFAETWGDVADDAGAIAPLAAVGGSTRAWVITGVVAAFDVALVGWYVSRRAREKRAAAELRVKMGGV
jgi:hypothetical protein